MDSKIYDDSRDKEASKKRSDGFKRSEDQQKEGEDQDHENTESKQTC